MNEDNSKTGEDGRGGPVGGERLAEARRLRQISLPDIARELHLDEAKVQALEENRFDVLGAPVFAKGHLRKYAELVGVPIDDLLADYYTMNRATGAPPVVGLPRKRRQRDINLGPWLIVVPLVLIAAGAVYWWLGRGPVPLGGLQAPADERPAPALQRLPLEIERAPPAVVALPPATVDDEPSDDSEPPAGSAATDDRADAAPVAATAAVPRDAAASRPVPAGQAITLRLAYSGECWTEVTDGGGERLFFDLGQSGRTVTVSGRPPLRVLLGDSNNVSLTVNGEPYVIAAADRRGDTARLSINR